MAAIDEDNARRPQVPGARVGSVLAALVYSFFVKYYVTGLTGALKE